MKYNEPFKLKPAYKDYLWGGTRLKKEFNKKSDLDIVAETWECSVHKDGESIVSTGTYKGKTLSEILKSNKDYLGTHPKKIGKFPILVKFIDAKKDLSVQVHPTDEYAYKYENKSFGKTEMWYVIDAEKDAKLIYGFNRDVTKEQVRKAIEEGKLSKYLQRVDIKKNDVFYIPSGTVHAICSGALVAEVQESSNLTYRLYDYDRVDKNGNKRELHIDKALDVLNFKSNKEPIQPLRVLKFKEGSAKELLCRCKYFQVFRCLINTKKGITYKTDDLSFHILLCYEGKGIIKYNDTHIKVDKGDTIFVPANSCELTISGKINLLDINS